MTSNATFNIVWVYLIFEHEWCLIYWEFPAIELILQFAMVLFANVMLSTFFKYVIDYAISAGCGSKEVHVFTFILLKT